MNTESQERNPIAVFKEQFETVVSEIPSTPDMPREKMFSAAVIAVTKTPDLLYADRASLFQSIRQCASDGLMPDGREAHLQIYNTKVKIDGKDTWIKKVQYNPMVWGITKRVLNSGKIVNFWAEVICEGEEYTIVYDNGCRQPKHIYDPMVRSDKIIGAYAVAVNKSGLIELETMDERDLSKVKAAAKTTKVWDTWPAEKAKVAVMRRLAKRLPLASEDKEIIIGNDTDFAKLVGLFPNEAARISKQSFTQRLAAQNATDGDQEPPMDDGAENTPDAETGAPVDDAEEVSTKSDGGIEPELGSEEFMAGSNCNRDGIPLADCPHEVGTQEAADWMAGWKGMDKATGDGE